MTLKDLLQRQQFLRFLLVGGFNTGVSYLIYAVLLWLGLSFALASLTQLVLSILISFKTQGRLVFGDPRNRRLWRFVLCWAAIYAANIALMSRLIEGGFSAYAAGALSLPFTTLCSYVAQKYFVFEPAEERALR